jgi:hypothetical protein
MSDSGVSEEISRIGVGIDLHRCADADVETADGR